MREPRPALLDEPIFTAKEVALEFGVKVTTIREWINHGKLRAIRIGKEYRVTRSALSDYIKDCEEEAKKMKELNKKRTMDPSPKWELTICVVCGKEEIYTSRDQRMFGKVICSNDQRVWRDDRLTNYSVGLDYWMDRSLNVWHRMARIMCAERNAIATEEAARGRVKRQVFYEVALCSECGRPTILTKLSDGVVTGEMAAAQCDHQWPGGSNSTNEVKEAT